MTINILEYLEQSANKYSTKIALADDKKAITFAEWKHYAESIGTAINRCTQSAVRKAILVFVDRKIDGLIGFMGVVESGNFYVPIDCKMPSERIRLIIDILNPIAAIVTTLLEREKYL